jgi:hypothetical protein
MRLVSRGEKSFFLIFSRAADDARKNGLFSQPTPQVEIKKPLDKSYGAAPEGRRRMIYQSLRLYALN